MFQYNHNEYYRPLLLQQVPANCRNALDVGCGDGTFARLLARQFKGALTGIDRDHTMIERARASTSDQSIRFIEADFMRYSFEEQFDFISAVASLHHMPCKQALEKMASLLRSGGVLVVLGLYREANLADTAIGLVAAPVNAYYALTRGRRVENGAPLKSPTLSLREIREAVSSTLPGASLQRLLLWRYLLTWQKPGISSVI